VSMVSILGGDDKHVALAELVDHGSEKTGLRAAPWIRITDINTIGQSGQAVQLAGTRYNLYIPDTGLIFVGCMAKDFADTVTFLATDILDQEGNSVVV
jgi:high-affinity K+ transport system ATPase subunit B